MGKLTINQKKEKHKLTAELIGRVDVMTAPQFETEVNSSLEDVTDLVLDFKQLEYISSAGLRVVTGLQKTMSSRKGKLTICSPAENIMDIFTATGLVDFLNIV